MDSLAAAGGGGHRGRRTRWARNDADLGETVRFLAAAAAVRRSATEIGEGASRIAEIVGALRSYSYLDRAPVQEVDVVRGIEDTLVLLGHVTTGIRIVREYDPDLPTITAVGGELNQVWTNLIRNAYDALAAAAAPTLTLRAARREQDVVVEVEDNGPCIPRKRNAGYSTPSTRRSRPDRARD